MPYRRDYHRAAYGRDYTHNLRWRYRTGYGRGATPQPYRGGGSYGRGYDWAEDAAWTMGEPARPGPEPPPEPPEAPSAWVRRPAPPYAARPAPRRARGYAAAYRRRARAVAGRPPRRYRRRGVTARRDYGHAYPYFSSGAALEAAQGYPPSDTLIPDADEYAWWPEQTFYGGGEEY